jgi:hypothetical protein
MPLHNFSFEFLEGKVVNNPSRMFLALKWIVDDLLLCIRVYRNRTQ